MTDPFFDNITSLFDRKGMSDSGLAVVTQRLIDNNSPSITYIGESYQGSLQSESKWRIRRELVSNNIKTIGFASTDFNKIWNNRSSLTYNGVGNPTLQNNYSINHDGINDASRSSLTGILNYDRLNAFSCFGWVKFDALGATIRYLFGKTSNATSFLGYGIEYNSGSIRVILASTIVAAANGMVISINPGLVINTWYHIGFTYDGSGVSAGIKLYINGVLQATAVVQDNSTLTITSAATFFAFGARNAAINFLDGKVDEVGVFSKSLSGAEVTTLYNAGAAYDISTSPLLANCDAFWRGGDGTFDTGITCVDVVNGNSMTLLNGASFILDAV